MINKELKNGVLTLTFMHKKPQNPFGDNMQNLLLEAMQEAENNDEVNCILMTGGLDRSFCVGGDFSEIINMKTDYDKISHVIGKIVELYISILKVSKPIIAAIDNYAIGLGFQLAILSDYRIATNRSKFCMPEVKNGVACTLGGLMLEHLINRQEMMRICYECDMLPIDYCKSVGIINEIVTPDQFLQKSFEKAQQYASYKSVSFRNTKLVNNNRFIEALKNVKEPAIMSHFKTFSGNVHQEYMQSILKTKQE